VETKRELLYVTKCYMKLKKAFENEGYSTNVCGIPFSLVYSTRER